MAVRDHKLEEWDSPERQRVYLHVTFAGVFQIVFYAVLALIILMPILYAVALIITLLLLGVITTR